MNTFAQRLSRLRYTYSTLLRLSKKRDHPQWLLALSGCKFSTLVSSSQTAADDSNGLASYHPEVMTENEFARNFFLSSYKYRKSVMKQNTVYFHVTNEQATELLKQDWSQKTDRELLFVVKRLGYNIRHSDEKIDSGLYENAFTALSDHLPRLKDDDVMILIRQLVPFRQFHEYIFYQRFCHQLNLECVKRFMKLSNDSMLMLCDMLYEMTHTTHTRECEYIWYAVRKLGNKPNNLKPHQLVQVLFFLNVCRKPPINMYNLEYRLQQCFDELSINEVGIAALGFFKTCTQIRSVDLLKCIIIKTIDNIDCMDNITIGAVAKLIRYSMQLTQVNVLKQLIEKIVPIEPRLTLMTLNNITHATARVALYHEDFLNRIIKRLNNELTTARIKDLEKSIYFFTTFNIDSNNSIYHNVIEELRTTWDTRRAQEIQRYPHMSRLLGHLSYVNIYPIDLIERVMKPEYIHKTNKGNYISSREYFVLDCSLQVEVPQYNGHFLRPYVRNQMLKKYFLDFQSAESSRVNILLMNVLQMCQEMFNNTSDIKLDRPLPHFTVPDVILRLDEQNRLVSIKEHLSKYEEGEIKWICKEDLNNDRLIVLVMGYHGVLIKDTHLPVGFLVAKIRQLAKIGYTPIMVSHIEWEKRETQEEKYDYIRQLLFQNNAPIPIT